MIHINNIFITPFSEHENQIEVYQRFLSQEEFVLAQRKMNQKLQHQTIINFALRRKILAEFLETDPTQLQFEKLAHGKPVLKNHSLHFNVSHSNHYWAMMVDWQNSVGIDIEEKDRKVEFLELARRFFHPEEVKYIESASASHEVFWRLWTGKEAILKNTGAGISDGLEKIHLSFDAEDRTIIIAPEETSKIFELEVYQPYPDTIMTTCRHK